MAFYIGRTKLGAKRNVESYHMSPSNGSETSQQMSRKTASSVDIAIRPKEEDSYFLKESGNFFDVTKPEQLSELREKIRNYSIYNDTLSIAVNLTAMFVAKSPTIECEDDTNREILQNLFDSENFDVFLQDFTKEYLISGEVTSYSNWNKKYRCFTYEQILDPDAVQIFPSMYEEEDRAVIALPPDVVEVMEDEDNPEHEDFIRDNKDMYQAYETGHGFNVDADKLMRVVNKAHPWDHRGYPFFTPALSALAQEESLDAALFEELKTLITPTIIGTVGFKANELGQGAQPWLPDQNELDSIKETYRTMMMAKFRLGLFPVGVHFENAFGNTNIPDLSKDYDRCEKKILRCVAAGPGLIDGSASGPFASNAINRDVYSNFLMSIRNVIANAFQKRIDTAIKGLDLKMYRTDISGKRSQVMDEDGNPYYERASLAFDEDIMKDSNTLFNVALQLRNAQVPLSNQTLADMSGTKLNVIGELRRIRDEKAAKDKMDVADEVADNNDVDLKTDSDGDIDDGTQGDVRSPLDKSNF